MRLLIEWVGGSLIASLFCWIFIWPPHAQPARQPKRHAEMQAWCSLDKQLDKELLEIMDEELPPEEKLSVYEDFRRRDKRLIKMARQFEQRWGEHPGIACQ